MNEENRVVYYCEAAIWLKVWGIIAMILIIAGAFGLDYIGLTKYTPNTERIINAAIIALAGLVIGNVVRALCFSIAIWTEKNYRELM